MLDTLLGFLPNNIILICAIIAFAVPYTVYKVNQKLHEYGDPAWKKTEKKARKQQSDSAET